MSIVSIAELDIDPDRIDSYKALLADEIEAAVQIEPGVLFLHAVSVKGAPEKVRVIECYADQAAYEAHLTTPHFLKYKAETAEMVRSLRLIETDPICAASEGRPCCCLTHGSFLANWSCRPGCRRLGERMRNSLRMNRLRTVQESTHELLSRQ